MRSVISLSFLSPCYLVVWLLVLSCDAKTRDEELGCDEVPGWSSWGSWSSCSRTCGKSSQQRNRTCSKDPGADCTGPAVVSRECSVAACPTVDGQWASWSNWTECSDSCGGGTQYRRRTCTSPPPENGGRECTGNRRQSRECNQFICPVDGGWGVWSEWSACSVTCGTGYTFRSRKCDNPTPIGGGMPCRGSSYRFEFCRGAQCPMRVKYRGRGCFKEGHPKAFPVVVADFRDQIDWWYIWKTVDACAVRVKQKGWHYFAIQSFGVCVSGPAAGGMYDRHGSSQHCWNGVGEEGSNFVYEIATR